MKIITTKLDYKIHYEKIAKMFDFFTVKFAGNDYAKLRKEFYEDYNFPVNVSFNKINYFCLPKGTFKKIDTKSYSLGTVSKINELHEDVLLNFIAKLSVSFDKSDRYSLSQNLFYYIEDIVFKKKNKGVRGVEPYIKEGVLSINAVNYKIAEIKSDLDKLPVKNRFAIEYKDKKPIIKNNLNGDFIKKGFGTKSLGQIKLFDTKAKTRLDLDKTKSGAIYHLINMMNDSGFINIKLKDFSSDRFRLKEGKFKKELPLIIGERIRSLGGIYVYSHLNNIDGLENIVKDEILNQLNDSFDASLIHIGKPSNEEQCGFNIHYSKDYYEENEIEDPYDKKGKLNSSVKQSLTVPFGEEKSFLTNKGIELIISKCLVELIIKADFHRKEKPTFSDKESVTGYCMEGESVYKYSDSNASVNIEDAYDLEDEILNDFEDNEFIVNKNEKLYKIKAMNFSAIPDIFKSYEMLAKVEKIFTKTISHTDMINWVTKSNFDKVKNRIQHSSSIKNLSLKEIEKVFLGLAEGELLNRFHEEFYNCFPKANIIYLCHNDVLYKVNFDKKKEDGKKKISNFENIEIFNSEEIKNLFSGITDNELLDAFYEEFECFPKTDIRYAYHGDTVYSHNMDISVMEGKYYTVGKTSNMKELGELQSMFTCKDMETDSYMVDMDLIRDLYEHYYIQTNSATKKPYFAKYVREFNKINDKS